MTISPDTPPVGPQPGPQRIRLVVMDIDGTLVVGGREAIDNVIEQLRRLKQTGIRFSVATGRTLHGARHVVEQLLGVRAVMPPMIAYNGGVIARPETTAVVHRMTLGRAEYVELIGAARALGMRARTYVCRHRLDMVPAEEVYGESDLFDCPDHDFNGMPIRWVENIARVGEDVVAVLLLPSRSADNVRRAAMSLASRFAGRLRITTSGGPYIEVAHPSGTKLEALRLLTHLERYELSEVMAIGDNYNDLEMIRGVGWGVAVSNSPGDVKAAARLVTSLSGAEGVVEALRFLLSRTRDWHIRRRALGKGDSL